MTETNAIADVIARYRRDPALSRPDHARGSGVARLDLARDGSEIAERLAIPRTRIESVVKFYSFLYDRPRGRYRVLFSDNITDRMPGSLALFEHMLERLKLAARRGLAPTALVSVDLTSCTGMCDQGPAMLVNNFAITRLTRERIDAIVRSDRGAARRSTNGRPSSSRSTTTSARRDTLLGDADRAGRRARRGDRARPRRACWTR